MTSCSGVYGARLCEAASARSGWRFIKLCHTLGGSLICHAENYRAVICRTRSPNTSADRGRCRSQALGADDAARGLFELAGKLGVRRALSEIGMRMQDIDQAADLAVKNPYWNPRPIEREAIRGLITRAWAGNAPVDDVKAHAGGVSA